MIYPERLKVKVKALATARHMSHRMVTGSRNAAPVPLTHGRFGYGVPKAKRNAIALDEVEDNIADFLPAAASFSVLEEGAASHPQPAAALSSALSETSLQITHEITDPLVPIFRGRTSPLNLRLFCGLWNMNWTTPAVGLMMTTLVVGPLILRKMFPP